jgi:hypothetical protein
MARLPARPILALPPSLVVRAVPNAGDGFMLEWGPAPSDKETSAPDVTNRRTARPGGDLAQQTVQFGVHPRQMMVWEDQLSRMHLPHSLFASPCAIEFRHFSITVVE